MTKRRLGRILALQLLYALDVSPLPKAEVKYSFWDRMKKTPEEIKGFAKCLVEGVWENLKDIDNTISKCIDNWRIERLSVIDRNILRLATYEFIHRKDIPSIVSIDEAIELAKLYSSDDSPSFVNGVLDKVKKVVEENGL
jgi:N utilization substance protein B